MGKSSPVLFRAAGVGGWVVGGWVVLVVCRVWAAGVGGLGGGRQVLIVCWGRQQCWARPHLAGITTPANLSNLISCPPSVPLWKELRDCADNIGRCDPCLLGWESFQEERLDILLASEQRVLRQGGG